MSPLTFVAVGDCIIARRSSHRKDASFVDLVDKIRKADVAFANLEITIPKPPIIPSSEYGGMHLSAPDFVLEELKWVGFNIYNVANNHSGDFTYKGFVDTMEAMKRHGLVYAGGGMNLGEARSPGYLETGIGRVAVLGAAASYSTGSHAAAARSDFPGRPGLSHLRVERDIVLTETQYAALREIDESLGTALVTERRKKFNLFPHDFKEGAIKFLGVDFYRGDKPAFRQKANEKDVEDICRYIKDAKRQADFVVMTLHAHQGINGDGNNSEMAEFLPGVTHAFIDAGADAFVGHGPHMLRPIEIYKGKPIFYSLGNFFFEIEAIRHYPSEMYERHKLGPEATPADVADPWVQTAEGEPKAFTSDRRFYETVLPVCKYENGAVARMDLYPVTLGHDLPRTRRGSPILADAETGRNILAGLAAVSAPFGINIATEPEGDLVVGRVSW